MPATKRGHVEKHGAIQSDRDMLSSISGAGWGHACPRTEASKDDGDNGVRPNGLGKVRLLRTKARPGEIAVARL
jgi:hypothetical protein